MTARTPTITSMEQVFSCVPIRTTLSAGIPETVGNADGLHHSCHYLSDIVNGDVFYFGQPIVSAAFVQSSATSNEVYWDPSDATGMVTLISDGAATGWLHVWSYPGISYTAATLTPNVTIGTPGAALVGDPLRGVPIRTTTTNGVAQTISGTKEELIRRCFYFGTWVSNDTFDLGTPVRSVACFPATDQVQLTQWDPDASNGRITVALGGNSALWLVIWSRR